jgi:hypothetical protein
MHHVWRKVIDEIADPRNQTVILATIASFLAWIITAVIRATFG